VENLVGKRLGLYEVVAPLGEGGMAAVYKAYQPSMNRYVALKILPRQLAGDPQFAGRFQQEAKVLAKLQHPHILPVFDFGHADGDAANGGYTYIVMPFIESGTLTDSLKGAPLPLPQIRRLVSQIGEALDYAHAHGLVHRDVKPSNVLMDGRGNCLLSDFGLAKMVQGGAKFTDTGGVLGTPAYMSPEQGQGLPLDRRSDVYSLGVMLYEMATGKPPFDADTPIAVVIKHIQEPLPLPRRLNPDLPEAVERVILKALAKDPADRFQTAREMVAALQAVIPATLPGKPSTQPPLPPTQPRAQTPAKLNNALLALGGALAFCLLAIICAASAVGAFVFFSPTRTHTPTATGTATATPTLTLTRTSTRTASPTNSPSPTNTIAATFTETPTIQFTSTATRRAFQATVTLASTALPSCIPPEFFDPFLNRCRLPDAPPTDTPQPGGGGGGGGGIPPTIPATPPPTIPPATPTIPATIPPTIPATGVPK
jgi:serine/threonine protein kinase